MRVASPHSIAASPLRRHAPPSLAAGESLHRAARRGELLCPDLRVGPAADLFVEHRDGRYGLRGGGALLYAGNDIRSRGRGPMELRGQRYKRNWMHANQAIYRVGGGVEIFRTEAQLHFYDVGYEYGGSYWKVHDPLSMEIWSLDERRRPLQRVRKGPKVFYCFRDLERTRAMKRSPHSRVYPACSQDRGRKRVRLGTSVGWSDIYPSDLRPPVGQRQRPARLLRLRDAGRPAEPPLRGTRGQQPLGPDHPPPLPRRPAALLS